MFLRKYTRSAKPRHVIVRGLFQRAVKTGVATGAGFGPEAQSVYSEKRFHYRHCSLVLIRFSAAAHVAAPLPGESARPAPARCCSGVTLRGSL
eukprot:1907527-Pyramimonas_sp.AAC.1